MDSLEAIRVTSSGRRGSSRPLIVETRDGPKLVKLRGAGQGTAPLVSEIIVGEIAEVLGLAVPRRSLVSLPSEIETVDWDGELEQLLAASVGVNLGFDYLGGAREIDGDSSALAAASVETRAAILWLDRLVMNPDRTPSNPNLLTWGERLWLIDHGAALGFQYRWDGVTEQSPRRPNLPPHAHLFEHSVSQEALLNADRRLAPRLTRDILNAATSAVPETFLGVVGDRARRRRAAFSAYLWKRLKSPRPFLEYRIIGAAVLQ